MKCVSDRTVRVRPVPACLPSKSSKNEKKHHHTAVARLVRFWRPFGTRRWRSGSNRIFERQVSMPLLQEGRPPRADNDSYQKEEKKERDSLWTVLPLMWLSSLLGGVHFVSHKKQLRAWSCWWGKKAPSSWSFKKIIGCTQLLCNSASSHLKREKALQKKWRAQSFSARRYWADNRGGSHSCCGAGAGRERGETCRPPVDAPPDGITVPFPKYEKEIRVALLWVGLFQRSERRTGARPGLKKMPDDLTPNRLTEHYWSHGLRISEARWDQYNLA